MQHPTALRAEIMRALAQPDPQVAVLAIWRRRGLRVKLGWMESVWNPLWRGWVERAQGNNEWLAQEIATYFDAFAQTA